MKRPLILVTNDDGIHAPGIQHLWNAMHEHADLIIVAPAVEQSAVGMAITVRLPIGVEQIQWKDSKTEAWAVKGTPADCVKIALSAILPVKPDLILSGINKGNNAGRNVLYSGTIGAVIEGIHQNIPGIAFSLDEESNPRFSAVESYIPSIVNYALTHPLPSGTFLNVNFPKHTEEGIKGVQLARQGREYWMENPQVREHPTEGKPYYWLGKKLAQFDEEHDSDIIWLRKGFAAVVPIHVGELTHHEHLSKHQTLFQDFINDQKRVVLATI